MRAVGLGLVLALSVATGARAADPAPEPEPEPCRAALRAHPDLDPIQAIRAEERERWREARRVGREARSMMRHSLGLPERPGSRGLVGAFHEATESHRRLMREARVLCGCRAGRGDPDDADCDRLYPIFDRGPGDQPPSSQESQTSDTEATPRESGS